MLLARIWGSGGGKGSTRRQLSLSRNIPQRENIRHAGVLEVIRENMSLLIPINLDLIQREVLGVRLPPNGPDQCIHVLKYARAIAILVVHPQLARDLVLLDLGLFRAAMIFYFTLLVAHYLYSL